MVESLQAYTQDRGSLGDYFVLILSNVWASNKAAQCSKRGIDNDEGFSDALSGATLVLQVIK